MSLPTGTVTFLFTDIEGSTQLWERNPEEMQTTLARHDQLVRNAIQSNNGAVFKTIGDAFCAAFSSATDAVAAAVASQRALSEEKWHEATPIKVRIAIHTGAAESRDSDYFGTTVNRVARLLSTAHGGQTVLSLTTCDLVQDSLGEGVALTDLGEHRLKDLARPERIFQLSHASLSGTFPPLRTLDSSYLPNNLPEQLTSFVGRASELAEASRLLAKERIVTLTGSGGCGKTRLAIQVAAENMEKFPDGVWCAELASVSDPAVVAQTIAGHVGIREEPGQTVVQALVSQLRRKRVLIVMDNCEHLLLECARLAENILKSCPDVRILATSRESLNIAGETTFRVPSLSLPDPRYQSTPQSLEAVESVRLFVDRAKAVVATFEVTVENAPSLSQLCYQLDGIPLAIELAAARIRSLTVDQIAKRLDDRFRLLTSGSRTALPRQQTLRALIDWSYDLLNPAEKATLRRLSVFAGGWTLAAAEAVTVGDPVEDWEVLDFQTSLVDKCLVSYESHKEGERYRLLETVRRYGREKLQESGEEEATLGLHLEWFSRFAAEAGSLVRGPNQKHWLEKLESEHDNLWTALEASRKRKDGGTSAQLALTLGVMLQYRGFLNDAVKAIESGLEALQGSEEAEPLAHARLMYERAGIHQDFGETDQANDLGLRALKIFEDLGDSAGAARVQNLLGQIAMGMGDFFQAAMRFDTSLQLFNEVRDELGVSIVRNNQGVMARREPQGSQDERTERLLQAGEFLQEALKIRRRLEDRMGEAETLNNLGVVSFESRDYDSAWTYYRSALSIERELRRTPGIGTALANLGEVAGILGDRTLAVRFMATSERILRDIHSPLAGAVRSMMLDLAHDMPKDELDGLVAGARNASVEASIESILSAELVTA